MYSIYLPISLCQPCGAKIKPKNMLDVVWQWGRGSHTVPVRRAGRWAVTGRFLWGRSTEVWIAAECSCQAQPGLTCPPRPFSWSCYLSASTWGLLSCIVMFYSASEEYWKIKRAATRAYNPSHPVSFTEDPSLPHQLPISPSSRAHLDLSVMMTGGCRFDIHYSAVGAGGFQCPHSVLWGFAESAPEADARDGRLEDLILTWPPPTALKIISVGFCSCSRGSLGVVFWHRQTLLSHWVTTRRKEEQGMEQ